MSKPHLVACPACARHVRVSETACPFCGVVLAASLRASAPPEAPGVRLARAAMFALGAGTLAIAPGPRAASATGCSSTGIEAPLPPYGIAPVPEAGTDGADDGGPDTGTDDGGTTEIPAYGLAPIPEDGGVRVAPPYGIAPVPDAGEHEDAGHDAGVTAIPLYGIAPVPDAGEHDGGLRVIPPYGIAPGFDPGTSE
jgi:hypothetical protein